MTRKKIERSSPSYFWLAPPENEEEQLRDPLKFSEYYTKLSQRMLPDITTLTSYGPFYYLFSYWANPKAEDDNCFFNLPEVKRKLTGDKENFRIYYNFMEWSLSILNKDNKGISPIGIRTIRSKLSGKAPALPRYSVTTQNALVRYLTKAEELKNGPMSFFQKLVKKFGKNKIVVDFFLSAIKERVFPSDSKLIKGCSKLLNLEKSPYNRDILKILSDRVTEVRIKQGEFIRKITIPEQFPPSYLPKTNAQRCVFYGECERRLGKYALTLFHRMLKESEKTYEVRPIKIDDALKEEVNEIESYRNKLPKTELVENLLDVRPKIFELIVKKTEILPEEFGSYWLAGRKWKAGMENAIRDFLCRDERTLSVHNLCRGQAERMREE